jgi:hypothetical protein
MKANLKNKNQKTIKNQEIVNKKKLYKEILQNFTYKGYELGYTWLREPFNALNFSIAGNKYSSVFVPKCGNYKDNLEKVAHLIDFREVNPLTINRSHLQDIISKNKDKGDKNIFRIGLLYISYARLLDLFFVCEKLNVDKFYLINQDLFQRYSFKFQ